MLQLSLQLCCLRRQSRYLGPQLLQFLAVLGLSRQDLLRSHLHISILAHPALSLSPCLMEGDVSMLPGVVTNVATEGWGVQPVDKTVAEHSGVNGVCLRCVQLGGQHQQVLRVPHYTLSHPLPPAVERSEQSREAPVVAEGCCEDCQNFGRCVCLPCCAGEHLPPGRSLQSLDQPLHCCSFLHPEVPEDALRLLNKFIGVAAIRLSSEVSLVAGSLSTAVALPCCWWSDPLERPPDSSSTPFPG